MAACGPSVGRLSRTVIGRFAQMSAVRLAATTFFVSGWMFLAWSSDLRQGAMFLLPLLVLLLLRQAGADPTPLIEKLAGWDNSRARRAPRRGGRGRPPCTVAAGGRLLADSLAGRSPPFGLVTAA